MKTDKLIIHTDGGSRGNPGPAASAFVIEKNNEIIHEGSKFLGITTNNVAEYTAVLLALKWLGSQKLVTNNYSLITFYLDSELVVKQLQGIYKIKDEMLKKLSSEIFNILKIFRVKISFIHVPREKNKEADLLVNKELDSSVLTP